MRNIFFITENPAVVKYRPVVNWISLTYRKEFKRSSES